MHANTWTGTGIGAVSYTHLDVYKRQELSRVHDPLVIRIAACFAIVVSFIPKVSAIISTMPSSIIGGVSFMLYGMISAIGVRNVVENKVDLTKSRNLIIAGVIFVCGLGFSLSLIHISAEQTAVYRSRRGLQRKSKYHSGQRRCRRG